MYPQQVGHPASYASYPQSFTASHHDPPWSPVFQPQFAPERKPGVVSQRGPPRKPQDRKHGLWVGNIPLKTQILELRDHFMPGSASEILSVFYMPASRSGFINFRTAEACQSAAAHFNNSILHGTPIKCRPRRPIQGPISLTTDEQTLNVRRDSDGSSLEDTPNTSPTVASKGDESGENEDHVGGTLPIALDVVPGTNPPHKGYSRYFILKSLALDDLIASVETGRWATQIQNEDVLNNAFNSSEAVYLIFSANKTGKFFGYAKMTSAITSTQVPPTPSLTSYAQDTAKTTPVSIPTPAIGAIPKGHIVDELCYGRMFWEADTEETAPGPDAENGEMNTFALQWISLERLPFSRTTHLRNPWNGNKAVKIARDGTELEPKIGGALCRCMH
ncbi:hypothetical protein BT63DRAFT_434097 [Microthyrium microscopicum]|uniref:YTH domain-containing protein n=1 Tax=Microthyrium microscopicum TaxID=703497 RepID=A0A6A6U1M4_9PEZI|nr:hypothetical protein BT63DRAFT_434097 [Microthyrium microscopicum]